MHSSGKLKSGSDFGIISTEVGNLFILVGVLQLVVPLLNSVVLELRISWCIPEVLGKGRYA